MRLCAESATLCDDPAGGVIAQCEWGKDNTQENIAAVFEAWA